ncbi:MAG: hypothetical protein HYS87_01955 [Candidatus Colwellbacteria bacterium]|nr:hypothetical protein [Candidatus Colwellbacteria bacterium]
MLSLTAAITLASYSAAVHGAAIWIARGYVVGTIVVFLLSLKFGRGPLTKAGRTNGVGMERPGYVAYDKAKAREAVANVVALIGCLGTLALWASTESAEFALLAILATDLVGLVPTFVNVWVHPKEEHAIAWAMSSWASLIALMVVVADGWIFLDAAYPFYIWVTSGAIALLGLRRERISTP